MADNAATAPSARRRVQKGKDKLPMDPALTQELDQPEGDDDELPAPPVDMDQASLLEAIRGMIQANNETIIQATVQRLESQKASLTPEASSRRAPAPSDDPSDEDDDEESDHRSRRAGSRRAIRRHSYDPSPEYRSDGNRDKVQTLSNGVNPTLDAWELQIRGKIRTNRRQYKDLEDQLLLLLRNTENPAQEYLMARMNTRSKLRFTTLEEAFEALRDALGVEDEEQQANALYRALKMKDTERFVDFRTQFVLLADKANIHKSVRCNDLWYKLSEPLQTALVAFRDECTTFSTLSTKVMSTDREMRLIKERERERRSLRLGKPSITSAPLPRTQRSSNGRYVPPVPAGQRTSTPQLPDRQRSKTPATDITQVQCYNCEKFGHYSRDCLEPKKSLTELKEVYGPD